MARWAAVTPGRCKATRHVRWPEAGGMGLEARHPGWAPWFGGGSAAPGPGLRSCGTQGLREGPLDPTSGPLVGQGGAERKGGKGSQKLGKCLRKWRR